MGNHLVQLGHPLSQPLVVEEENQYSKETRTIPLYHRTQSAPKLRKYCRRVDSFVEVQDTDQYHAAAVEVLRVKSSQSKLRGVRPLSNWTQDDSLWTGPRAQERI